MRKIILQTLMLLLTSIPSFANQAPSIFDLFSQKEVLEVNLKFDIERLNANRRTKEDFHAVLDYELEGTSTSWEIEVAPRGKFRRNKCADIPPLKLKFKKSDLASKGFSKSNDFKLVPQCTEDQEVAKEILLREYLAYKLYNVITDQSYRVQLLKINYEDSKTSESKAQWAFLIEDTAQLRERVQAKKFKFEGGIDTSMMDREQLKTVALFNYMIGNFDYNHHHGKNVKPIMKDGKVQFVPYDFDFSIMVKAPYATLSEDIKIKHWTDRVYLGFDSDLDNIESTYAHFSDKKKDLIREVKSFKLLSSESREEIEYYLNSFFKQGLDIKTKAFYQAQHEEEIAERRK